VRHLVFNLLFLYLLGGQVEIRLGSIRFLVMFFLPVAVAANVIGASFLWSAYFGGISGVDFSVFGYLAASNLLDRSWPKKYSLNLVPLAWVGLSLIAGIIREFRPDVRGQGVGNMGHIVGLVIGVLFAAWFHAGARGAASDDSMQRGRE
jgi:GlpG protein